MAPGRSVAEIVAQLERPNDHGFAALRADVLAGLQAALELELATLPLYMTACWSIVDVAAPARATIREIFEDEMWHLANVCNLIAGLGGAPLLRDRAPTFPGALPGGVHPRLRLSIDRLSRASLRSFMELEHPARDVVSGLSSPEAATVGRLYARLAEVLATYRPVFDVARQLDSGGPQGEAVPSADAPAACAVLQAIAAEGEGSDVSPDDRIDGDRAHYYRFAELYYGRALVWDDVTNTGGYTGDVVTWPRTYAVAELPDGGWTEAEIGSDAWQKLAAFDALWTDLLANLQATWAGATPDKKAFGRAFMDMRALEDAARSVLVLGYVPRYRVTGEA